MSLSALKPSPSWLYSRFPGGGVGLALLVLRLVDGLGLTGEAVRLFVPAGNSPEPASVLLFSLVLVTSAALLMLGLQTSLAASAAALCTAGSVLYTSRPLNFPGVAMNAWFFLFALLFFLSSSLALLGPGGYSLDARLSGWRTIRLSTRQSNSNGQKEGRRALVTWR